MSQLVPCPGCFRHVRWSEPACPFCGDVSPRPAPVVRQVLRRSRSAVLGATLAATTAAAGCYDEHGTRTDTGVLAPDAARQPDTGGTIAAYGTPTPDDAALAEPDAGGSVAEYGGPPLFEDAGMGDPGADYGSPPSD